MIAWLLNVSEERARDLKWLIFVLAFDILSLLFRLTGEFVARGVPETKLLTRQLAVLLESGYTLPNAAAMLAGSSGFQTTLPDPNLTSEKAVSDLTREVESGGSSGADQPIILANDNGLYLDWIEQVKDGLIKCTQNDAKRFISANMAKGCKTETITPMGMIEVHKRWLEKATAAGILKPLGGSGKPSHVLA